MKYNVLLLFTLMASVMVLRGQNVLISSFNAPEEPSIMMDPKHVNVLLAGANINNYFVSLDTGHTWVLNTLGSSYGVWGDPAIFVDTLSNFYFIHLSNPPLGHWIDRIVCQKTSDNGVSFNDGSYTGLNGAKNQDKAWCAVDRANNNIYMTWTQFDSYGSNFGTDSSNILFSKSVDLGLSWSTPVKINHAAGNCMDSDSTVEGAVPAAGPNGEVYVGWAGPNGLVFNRSVDQGNSWLSNEIFVGAMPGGWDYSIPGIYRSNGLPITACDLSNGPYRGTIYMNWSDQRNGVNNTDVWLTKSVDGGNTWSAATKVNDDLSNNQQFLTYMTIDRATGYLYFVFYDRRNYSGDSTDVYVAVSMDGGTTFINRRISESAFVPDQGTFFGDYTNIVADNGIIRPIWARMDNTSLSVWTDLTTLNEIVTEVNTTGGAKGASNYENYPNPTKNDTNISFELMKDSKVNLSVYNLLGTEVYRVINNERRVAGKYVERVDLRGINIASGSYILKLEVDGEVITSKLIVVK